MQSGRLVTHGASSHNSLTGNLRPQIPDRQKVCRRYGLLLAWGVLLSPKSLVCQRCKKDLLVPPWSRSRRGTRELVSKTKARGLGMKIVNLRLTTTAALVLAFVAVGRAADREESGGSGHGYQAKLEYCKTCHGLSGEGYRGYYPMPRLAGQQSKYIENQLRAFSERRRVNPVMFNVAHVLSPATLAALSAHFMNLNPAPIGGGPKDHLALGKTIYDQGLPESNVPACSACHGPEARGHEEIPRLAGQLYPYTLKALAYWGKERGQGGSRDDTSAIMAPTTHNLTREQMAAIAAYLSYMK